jgi:serine/threonine protein kinase
VIGTTVGGRYRIVRLLGQGGMGVVYEARHTGTTRRVALKLITDKAAENPELLARFRIEAMAAGVIESEHIARVIDLDSDERLGLPYLVMELLEGADVKALFADLGRVPPDLALRIGVQVCRGLTKAHAANVIHRDIKPANIFLASRDNERCIVKLLDFGIAKMRNDELAGGGDPTAFGNVTTTGALMGSPMYMSPEQTMDLRKVDGRSDVWSLGVVLFEGLTGRTPLHDAEGIGDLILRLHTERPSLRRCAPWVPPAVATIVDRALAIKLDHRWPTVDAMMRAMLALLGDDADINQTMLVPADTDAMLADAAEIEAAPLSVDDDAPLSRRAAREVAARFSPIEAELKDLLALLPEDDEDD